MKRIMLVLMMVLLSVGVFAEWEFYISIDEMTNEQTAMAFSKYTKSSSKMNSPYTETECFLTVANYDSYIAVIIIFNNRPNINDTKTEDGYNLIKTRVKFGEDIEYITMTQEWGSRTLVIAFDSLKDKEDFIIKLKEHDEMLLELKWYGQGSVYFPIQLNGSTKFINKVLNFN